MGKKHVSVMPALMAVLLLFFSPALSAPVSTLTPAVTVTLNPVFDPPATPTVAPIRNPNFLINAGYLLANSYSISQTIANNNGASTTENTLVNAPDSSEFFLQVMYRNRSVWTEDISKDFDFGFLHIFSFSFNNFDFFNLTELKFGTTFGSEATNVQTIVGGGDVFGESSIDLLGFDVDDTDQLKSHWSLGGILGGSTYQGDIFTYAGLGIVDAMGLQSPVTEREIEVLASYYPWTFADEPVIQSQAAAYTQTGPPPVQTQYGFVSHDVRSTALVGINFSYPINQDHFLTVQSRFFVHELSLWSVLGDLAPSELDSWSFQIGLTQSFDEIGGVVAGVFNGLTGPPTSTPGPTESSTPEQTSSPSPTETSTPTETPTATPTETPTVTHAPNAAKSKRTSPSRHGSGIRVTPTQTVVSTVL